MASKASEPAASTPEGQLVTPLTSVTSVTAGTSMTLTSRFSIMAVALQSLVVSGGVSDGEEEVEVAGSDTASAGRVTPDTVTIVTGGGHRLSEGATAVVKEMLQGSLDDASIAKKDDLQSGDEDGASVATKDGLQSGVDDCASIATNNIDSHPNTEDTNPAAFITTKLNVEETSSEHELQNGRRTVGLLHSEGDVDPEHVGDVTNDSPGLVDSEHVGDGMNASPGLVDPEHVPQEVPSNLSNASDDMNMLKLKEEYFTQKEIQGVFSADSSNLEPPEVFFTQEEIQSVITAENSDPEVRHRLSSAAPNDHGEGTSIKEGGPFDDLWLPTDLPHILEIKQAIPKHCFESSVATSLYYMGKDFAIVAALYVATAWSWANVPLIYQFIITPVFWLLQGTMFWAIFVVGHDGGHGSFSRHEWLNDVIGNLCHTVILTPYYMWKLTHRNHHKNTGNMDKDDVFYPCRQSQRSPVPEFPDFFVPAFGLGAGWFMFLTKGFAPRRVIHWNPWDSFFKNHVRECIVSLGCLLAWLLVLNGIRSYIGVLGLLYYYIVPVFIFASYLVIVTFLQHSEMEVPWYSDHLWSNVRGQLSTVDRDYGWCHYLTHCIGTHQVHHLFPKIPHYNLMEATAAFRAAFPQLVNAHHDRILPSFWRMHLKFRDQHVCVDATQVFLYKDA